MEKYLVPLAYIKSEMFSVLLLKSYQFGDTSFSSDSSDMHVFRHTHNFNSSTTLLNSKSTYCASYIFSSFTAINLHD